MGKISGMLKSSEKEAKKIASKKMIYIFAAALISIAAAGFALEMHTGQTTSYRTGDDADIDGTPKSYTDNGDGTVTDDATGLVWQKDDQSSRTWENALSYCNSLSSGSGGLSDGSGAGDWRLPTVYELDSMIDFSRSDYKNPALIWDDVGTSYFWSSTTRPDNTGYAYRLYMGYGGMYNGGKTNTYYVRCVRDA